MELKTCSKCERELPLDCFYRASGESGRRRRICRECFHKDYLANREKNLANAAKHRELNREKNREYARKWREANPDKVKELQKSHYAKNRDKEREDSKRYRRTHKEQYSGYGRKRRARLANNGCSLTLRQWEEIKLRYKHKCAYCGAKEDLTMDHVTPISKGGSHSADNVVPACKTCNCSKQANPAPLYVQTMLVA